LIQQSQTLTQDKTGAVLPQSLENLLDPNGQLPDVVPKPIILAERGTYFWLFEKIIQLSLYAPCSSAPYPFASAFAPGFGPPTFHYINEVNPTNTNFTFSPIGISATGK